MQKMVRSVVACTMAGAMLGAVSLVGLGALGGCVNPRSDYDDFVNRTNGVRGVSTNVTDAAAQEASAIDGGFTAAPFFIACLPRLVGGKVNKALRFAGTITFTPTSTTTKAGTIDLDIKPLTTTATDMSSVVGNDIIAKGTPVRDDGSFDASFGSPTIPLAANPITSNDIVFGSVIMRGILLRADFACAELDGDIVLPSPLDLNDPGDFCILQAMPSLTSATPTPDLTADQFLHCP